MNNTDGTPPAGTWLQRNGGLNTLLPVLALLIALVTYLQLQFNDIRTEFRDVRASIDRVETKVDEVRGALNYNAPALAGPASSSTRKRYSMGPARQHTRRSRVPFMRVEYALFSILLCLSGPSTRRVTRPGTSNNPRAGFI